MYEYNITASFDLHLMEVLAAHRHRQAKYYAAANVFWSFFPELCERHVMMSDLLQGWLLGGPAVWRSAGFTVDGEKLSHTGHGWSCMVILLHDCYLRFPCLWAFWSCSHVLGWRG